MFVAAAVAVVVFVDTIVALIDVVVFGMAVVVILRCRAAILVVGIVVQSHSLGIHPPV